VPKHVAFTESMYIAVMSTEKEIPFILSYTQRAVTHKNKHSSVIVSLAEVGSK